MLIMRVTAADEAALAALEDVVARHLVRFAFREGPEVRWTQQAEPQCRAAILNTKTTSGVVAATRIAAGDARTRYDGFAMSLHWLTVALVLTQFGLSQLWGFAPRATRHLMIVSHMSCGIILAAVMLVRIAWRLMPFREHNVG
jgi:hypothetical protein